MTIDPGVIPGLLLLAAEFVVLAAIGFVVVRVALRQTDDSVALAQGLVVGLVLWGLLVNFVLYVIPGIAGAIVGWAAMVAIGAGLAWRAPQPIRPQIRTTAGFVVAALALFWVALASHQLLGIPDAHVHLSLAASIRDGGYPPAFPWHPDLPIFYHYGTDLLSALLTPPFGPDLAFVTELLGAYIWTSLALAAVTTVAQRGSWLVALVVSPLLLTAGAWTLIFTTPPDIVHIPVPTGVPMGGLRASLAEIFWHSSEYPWKTPVEASPGNIWTPWFVLAYALALVVLERATGPHHSRHWLRNAVLALLIGFLGLVDETVALIVLALWFIMEAARFLAAVRVPAHRSRAALRAATGPVLATLLLAVGGGVITGTLTGVSESGLSLGWIADANSRQPLGLLTALPGGIGVLGLGVVPVAAAAVLLGWRDRLAVTLAIGAGVFLLAALTLQYEFSRDVARLDGHARNFALLALLVALSFRLQALRPRWRYTTSALVFALIAWPTAIAPIHNLGLTLGSGPRFTNHQLGQDARPTHFADRHPIGRLMSEAVAAYIREHTAVDARILSPIPTKMSIVTGRPNASAYANFIQFIPRLGPEYLDAIRYLEPRAIKRLGFDYVHATDAWIDGLPDRAVRWLQDSQYFELLTRDKSDALYRVQSAFQHVQAAPAPASYEALRQAVPASARVYLSPSIEPMNSIRAASVLSHARLLGVARRPLSWHSRPDFPTEPLGQHTPDFVITSARLAPSAFPPGERTPVWWNHEIAVYALEGAIEPIMSPPPPLFSVRLSGVHIDDGHLAFTATLSNEASGRWTGQDWLVVATDASPWMLPHKFEVDGRTHVSAQWFGGQIAPSQRLASFRYVFDAHAPSLTVQDDSGRFTTVTSSGESLSPGGWMLALRLRDKWWETAFIPVVRIVIAADGAVSYEVYGGAFSVRPVP